MIALLVIFSSVNLLHRVMGQFGACVGGKNQAIKGQVTECPFTASGYHIPCAQGPFNGASELCRQFGWQLAALNGTDSNMVLLDILSLQEQCARPFNLWIQSLNGYASDPCMFIDGEGVVRAGASDCFALDDSFPLCQEIPPLTITEYSTTTTSVTFGVQTQTVVTYDPAHCSRGPEPEKPCRECFKKPCPCREVEKSGLQGPPACPHVCPFEVGRLRLITDPNIASSAAEACAYYNWQLADLGTGQHESVVEMMRECGQLGNPAWLRSWNGIVGAQCVGLFPPYELGPTDYYYLFDLLGVGQCAASAPVICEVKPEPGYTGFGPYSITYATDYVTTPVTVTDYVPSTTKTVTFYLSASPSIL